MNKKQDSERMPSQEERLEYLKTRCVTQQYKPPMSYPIINAILSGVLKKYYTQKSIKKGVE